MLTEGLPMHPGVQHQACRHTGQPDSKENLELHLNNWWRPQLTVIGMEGLPTNLNMAGNAIVRDLKLRCSMRLAPTQKGSEVVDRLREILLKDKRDETFGAKIDFEIVDVADGFCAPEFPETLRKIVFESTHEVFNGNDPVFVGCGGSIPFMEVMSREFPKANFLLVGVGFADSNAHSANENLRLGFCSKLATTISLVLSRF